MANVYLYGDDNAGIAPVPTGVCYFRTSDPPSGGPQLMEHPFDALSACNRPIGVDATYAGTSDPARTDLMKVAVFDINKARGELNGAGSNNYGHGWIVGTSSDPLVHVVTNGNDNVNLPADVRIPHNFTGGTKDGGADQGVTIFDTTTGITSQFFQFFRVNDNNATAAGRRLPDLAGRDWSNPWPNGTRISSSASRIAQLGLDIRGSEFNLAVSPPVQHALNMALGSRPSDAAIQMSRNFIWPASGVDGFANNPGNNTGNIDYGTLWAIPPEDKGGPNFDSLAFLNTPQRRRMADVWRSHGIYSVDVGGSNTMRADQYLDNAVRTSLMAMMTSLKPYLRRVTNNTQGTLTAGGGTPLMQPNCAYNATGVDWRAS